jgi:Na+/proline symporter
MFLIESVLYTFLLTETLATFVGISVLGGIVWPRANRWGALASLVTSLATNFLLYYLAGERLDRWDPNVFLAALVAGIAALVVVSVITRPEPASRLDPFFDRLQTSSDGAASPTPRAEARPLLLVNILRLRSATAGKGWRVFAEDLGGLAIGFALVAALVGATALLLAM